MSKIELSGYCTPLQHRHIGAIAALILISLLSSFSGLPIHHSISNSWEGFLWGMAEPVMSWNHLLSLVMIGLISALMVDGALIAASFVLATVFGTIIHLFWLSFTGAEIAIAVSTITFGLILMIAPQQNWVALALLSAIAGLFYGYVDGESIQGIGIVSLVAYVLGFTLTQYVVAMTAREIHLTIPTKIRFTGLTFSALGMIFLTYYLQ